MIHSKYKSDPNQLAEALCGNRNIKSEAMIAAEADFKMIGHAKHFLLDWLGNYHSRIEEQLVAVIQEPGYEFTEQIDSAIEWIASQRSISLHPKPTMNRTVGIEKLHSSVLNGKALKLSPLGTCCMARYFAEDYALLLSLLQSGAACKGTNSSQHVCKAALSSIWDRRAMFLNNNNLSCHQQQPMVMLSSKDKKVINDSKYPLFDADESSTTMLIFRSSIVLRVAAIAVLFGLFMIHKRRNKSARLWASSCSCAASWPTTCRQ